MTVFNVRQTVVELVEADTAEQAQEILAETLEYAGFEVFVDVDTADAFESEPLAEGTSVLRRGLSHNRYWRGASA